MRRLYLFILLLIPLFFAAVSWNCGRINAPGTPKPAPTPTGCEVNKILSLVGNLDSSLAPPQPGAMAGVRDGLGNWIFPFDSFIPYPTGGKLALYGPADQSVIQMADFRTPVDSSSLAPAHHAAPLALVQPNPLPLNIPDDNHYAWTDLQTYPAAATVVKSFNTSGGQSLQITFIFYQLNSMLGVTPLPNDQVAYAWYAFSTTATYGVSDDTLLGGSFCLERDPYAEPGSDCLDNRGGAGDVYWGDLLFFNSDGSLGSEGAVRSSAGQKVQAKPHLIIIFSSISNPGVPTPNPEVIEVNFGTAGMLGYGKRDGVTGDAAPANIH